MQDTLQQRSDETIRTRNGLVFGYLLAIVVAATIALVFSLMGGVGWGVSLMIMAGSGVLTGLIFLSVAEVLKLRPRRPTR